MRTQLRIIIPAMIAQGDDRCFASSVVSSASTVGPVIPPSIPMILYGVMASVSIGDLFIAGVVPGILMAVSHMVYVYYFGKKNNIRVREKMASTKKIMVGLKMRFFQFYSQSLLLADSDQSVPHMFGY
jgi:C4-dicarboxylate transporter DctM subunit